MRNPPELTDEFPPPEEIIQAGLNGDLVLFVGSGASRLLGLPSWDELANKVLEDLRKKGLLNYSEIQQLQTLDAKKRLSIAKIIAEDNGNPLEYKDHLSGVSEGDSIYKALNDIGCSSVTTNYDELLSPRHRPEGVRDGSVTHISVNRVSDRENFFARLLNEPGTVIHLHGSVSNPETMIVTTKDYLEHYDHPKVKELLIQLFKKKIVLFLGYGLEEAEILEHILRRGQVHKTTERRRFSLQGFFRSEKPLYEKLHAYYENSFGVHLLGFERDKEDYKGLEFIIKLWANQLEIRKHALVKELEFMDEVLGSE